jgi:hypothetical protein
MSYTIKKSDGTTLATVPENDIVLDAASVALIGRGATNYGAAHSEAFVHILENFSNSSAPAHPLTGQLWFDTTVGAMKVYKSTGWEILGGGGGGGSGGGGDGGSGDSVGGPIYVPVTTNGVTTSVILMVAGGQAVAAISSRDIPQLDLPINVTVLNQTVPFQSRFPLGLEGGVTLANDITDYLYAGHQKHADQSDYVGGGTPFGATTFVDLGSTTVTLSISNGQIIAAFSATVRAAGTLPTNVVVGGNTIPFAAAFPNGLAAGLTLATGFGINSDNINAGGGSGSVTTQVVAEMINEEAEARATAVTNLYAYADQTYAQAGLVNTMNAEFQSATGQDSLASAIDWLVATAGSGTANAQYAIDLKAEITNAITGATSFASALAILNTAVTTDYVAASDLTTLSGTLHDDTYNAISNAISGLTSSVFGTPKYKVQTVATANVTALTGEQTIGGFTTSASTILLAGQTDKTQNGVWVTGSGAWHRPTDADSWNEVLNLFVYIVGGTAAGSAWVITGPSIGTINVSQLTVTQQTINSSVASFWNQLNSTFETDTGYASIADAVNDLKTISTGGSTTAAFDTDLRTRLTNAMQAGSASGTIQTINDALGKLSTYSGLITTNSGNLTDLINSIKQLTGTGVNESTATAVQKLISQSGLTSALATFKTTLTTEFVSDMNEVTGGVGTTFAQAISDVIASSSSDGTGSTSSIDTNLRNLFISATNETNYPVTTISEAVQKLMTNTTKDRANADAITALTSTFTTGLGASSLADATSKLSTAATNASSASSAITTLNNSLISGTGKSSVANAVDYLTSTANASSATASKVTTIETALTSSTGAKDVSSAVQSLFSRTGNLIPDPYFFPNISSVTTPHNWNMAQTARQVAAGATNGFVQGDAAFALEWDVPPTTVSLQETNDVPTPFGVTPGQKLYFGVNVQKNSSVPSSSTWSFAIAWLDTNGTRLSQTTNTYAASDLTAGTSPKLYEQSATVPAGAVKAIFIIVVPPMAGNAGSYRFERPYVSTSKSNNNIVGWSVHLDNNGYVSGLDALNGGPGQSTFTVNADKFVVTSPTDSNPTPPFYIQDGVTYIRSAKILNGAITTVQAASTSSYFYLGEVDSPISINFASGTVPVGSKIIVWGSFDARQVPGHDNSAYQVVVRRYKNGVFDSTLNNGLPCAIRCDYTSGTAQAYAWTDTNFVNDTDSYTYQFHFSYVYGAGFAACQSMSIVGMVTKK